MDASVSAPPPGGHPRRWAILGVLVLSLLVVVVDNTVLNVALKVLADPVKGLGATQGELQWAINSYTLVFAGLLLAFGILGDRVGRRRTLVFGLGVFGAFSLVSAYTQSPGQLIAARAVMGIGAAAVMPATLSIISNVFDPKERAKAIGVWAASVGVAVAIGPVIGGLLLDRFWWGSVFLINVPIIVVGVALVFALVPESRDPRPSRVDGVGVLLSIAGLVALVYGVIEGGDSGEWSRWDVRGGLVAGVVVLAGFVLWERRIDHPTLDVRLFRDARFSSAVGAIGAVFLAGMGAFFFLAFYLQVIRGYTPLQAGLLLLPFAAGQLLFAVGSAAMVRRFGPKAVCASGLALVAVSAGSYVWVGAATPVGLVLVALFAQGAGMANVMPPAIETLMSMLPRERAGVGSAVANTIRQVGGALGVAVIGSVLTAVYRDRLEPALRGAEPAAGAAKDSIAAAHAVAAKEHLPGLVGPADRAFLTAMHYSALTAAVIAALGALAVLVWMPRRSAGPAPAPAPAAAAPESQMATPEITPVLTSPNPK